MKIRKIISVTINIVLGVLLIGTAYIVISSKTTGKEPSVFGYQLKTVLSGSMEPGIKTGSIIVIKPVDEKTSFKEGDVITFIKDSMTNDLVTHRIIEVINDSSEIKYVTKGDNNEDPDKSHVSLKAVVGQYTGLTVPYIGYFLNFATSKEGTALFMGVPAMLLLFYSFSTLKVAFRDLREKKNDSKSKTV